MRFLIFLLPWLELFTLIQLGIETSALTALAWVLLTAIAGFVLLQRQGQNLFAELRQESTLGPQFLADEMALGMAGLLLIVPGLITDCLALLVVLGPVRRRIVSIWKPAAEQPSQPGPEHRQHTTIEGEFHRVDPDDER